METDCYVSFKLKSLFKALGNQGMVFWEEDGNTGDCLAVERLEAEGEISVHLPKLPLERLSP